MKPVVMLINYGMGNLFSVSRALEHCGAEVRLTSSPDEVLAADRVLLPGVGAFQQGMGFLSQLGLVSALQKFATSGRPLLGICLGMQMLFESSEEFGVHEGLGIIGGSVLQIPSTDLQGNPHKIPHIGWSPLLLPEGRSSWSETLLTEVEVGKSAYFLHSFAAVPSDRTVLLAETQYNGRKLCAAVKSSGNVWGCQFHPEKSGETGLKILGRFVNAQS